MTRAPNELSRAASFTIPLRWLGLFYPSAADAEITKASVFRFLAVIDVPEVNKDPAPKRFRNFFQVERPELVPLGHDDEGVRTGCRGVGVVREIDAHKNFLCLLASHRIVRAHFGAAFHQDVNQRD